MADSEFPRLQGGLYIRCYGIMRRITFYVAYLQAIQNAQCDAILLFGLINYPTIWDQISSVKLMSLPGC
jgi:hypothetical protein